MTVDSKPAIDEVLHADAAPMDSAADVPLSGQAAPEPCYVIGIGASAGGQEALEQLFSAMPADCGLSFVVIMHLPPQGPSFLADMLRRYTTMEVVTAEDGMPLGANRVQVIPAGMDLTVSSGRLRLAEAGKAGEARRAHHPIDLLFTSLATEYGERAIAVILSGFGNDGTAGARAIRKAGGYVVVQDPDTAVNPPMPKSAIAGGAADLILSAEEIPVRIAAIAGGSCPLTPGACRVATIDEELHTLFNILKLHTGHDFSSYKSNTIVRRIERRMAVNDVSGIGKYVALLRSNPQEAHALCRDILIGVTSFFRDPEAFENLRRHVIPQLFANRHPDDPVRIWHACCATGEEVYSMAMLIREYLEEHQLNARVQLFASDIDETAIAQARSGLYGNDIAAEVGESRLRKFFNRGDGCWQVAKSLREMVVFAHHSLIKDPPFSRLDLLVCRNFLIYLTPDMQKRLVALFHQSLKPGGFLFLGSAESVGHHSDLFTTIDNKWKIFCRGDNSRRATVPFPFTAPVRIPATSRPVRNTAPEEQSPASLAEKLLIERYAPPCVVVNEKYETVHVTTRARRFLEVPLGEPTRDILKMAREELRPALRAAIYKAFAEKKPVVFRGVKVVDEDAVATVSVLVEPLPASSTFGNLAIVVIEPAAGPERPSAVLSDDAAHSGDETSRETLIRQLEEQLRITHEQLQATTEQLESSNEGFMSANEELLSINEEFQSANEELQSTNEELETSKEELQALNEELVTVNAELQDKIEELNKSNSDMQNLLTSSEIATIFLDRQLCIKGFTPAVAAIFNLLPSDIGRPFRHLAGKIDWSALSGEAEQVLAEGAHLEREVTTLEEGHCYLQRLLPYRNSAGRIDGVVVTLIDISMHKRSELALLRAKQDWERTFDSVPDLIAILDDNHRILRVNQAMAQRLGVTPQDCIGTTCYKSVHGSDQPHHCCPHILTLADGKKHEEEQYEEILDEYFIVTTTPLLDETGQSMGTVHVARDITKRKQAEIALQQSEERLKRAQEISHLGSWELDLVNDRLSWSDEVYRIFGLEPQAFAATYSAFLAAVHPDDRQAVNAAYTVSLREERDSYEIEHRVVRNSDGAVRYIHEKCEHIRDESGRIVRSTGMVHDITERKRAEVEIQRRVEELRASNEELERFNLASVGRELRMIELKKEINDICCNAGLPPRYALEFAEEQQ